MSRGDLLGLVAAFAVTIALFVALWFFLTNYWAAFPAWLAVCVCILFAVAAIGSPIYALGRISSRMLARQTADTKRTDAGESGPAA